MDDAEPVNAVWADPDRLAALDSYDILDTPREAEFDDLVALAARACGTSSSLISLVTGDRQWFKAEIGFGPRETPLAMSICASTVALSELVVIPDMTADSRLADNALVTGAQGLRFYAGAPLITQDGFLLGTLCVLDRVIRPQGLSEKQAFALWALARQVMSQLELRRLLRRGAQVLLEQRRIEQALRESEEAQRRLAQGLEERVRAEVAAREAAQMRLAQAERLQALGQLASGIAHDFNNVLQSVTAALRMVRKWREDPGAVGRWADMADEAVARGGAITGRLLAFARPGPLQVSRVCPRTLLAEMQDVLRHTLRGGISMTVCADDGLPPILVDRAQLETVLINLCINARDAMPKGGRLELSADLAETDIASGRGGFLLPQSLASGRYVRVGVADTGAGMTPEILDRATEPFFTTKPVGQGTGLGLSMARSFAEKSGGCLVISSEPGAGTTVTIWLPCADTSATVSPGLSNAA